MIRKKTVAIALALLLAPASAFAGDYPDGPDDIMTRSNQDYDNIRQQQMMNSTQMIIRGSERAAEANARLSEALTRGSGAGRGAASAAADQAVDKAAAWSFEFSPQRENEFIRFIAPIMARENGGSVGAWKRRIVGLIGAYRKQRGGYPFAAMGGAYGLPNAQAYYIEKSAAALGDHSLRDNVDRTILAIKLQYARTPQSMVKESDRAKQGRYETAVVMGGLFGLAAHDVQGRAELLTQSRQVLSQWAVKGPLLQFAYGCKNQLVCPAKQKNIRQLLAREIAHPKAQAFVP